MNVLYKSKYWYAPAEAAVPIRLILKSLGYQLAKGQPDRRQQIGSNFYLGDSARTLLYALVKELSKRADQDRKQILIPGYTCYSVAAAVVKAGLNVAVYDIEPSTLNPDFDSLEKAISEKTLAVISQHLFGIPTATEALHQIAHAYGAVHIEDAAQAMGGKDHSDDLGKKGDFGVFSLGRGKPLPLGRGGILVVNKDASFQFAEIRKKSLGVIDLANAILARIISKPILYRIAEELPLGLGETHFKPAFKTGAMPVLMKRLLFESMPLLKTYNQHRNRIALEYRMALPANAQIREPKQGQSVYTRFPILAPSGKIARKFTRFGIRQMYPNCLIDEGRIRPFISPECADTPGARELAKRLITLPTHSMISNSIAGRISNTVRNYLT